MFALQGEPASEGIAVGVAHILAAKVAVAERRVLRGDREAEVCHLEEGISAADEQLERLQQELARQSGTGGDLVEVHRMILRCPELAGEARRLILEECHAAEWAVSRAVEGIRVVFAKIADPFFRARGGDFEAVGERLIRTLLNLPELRGELSSLRGAIVVAVELAPFEPVHLKAAGVAGIVAEDGGRTSHTAIMARALGLPYVVGLKGLSGRIQPGAILVVDGTRGDVVVDAPDEVQRSYRERADAERRRDELLLVEKNLPAVTTDGVPIALSANVESLLGIEAVVASGADGIGLFRTEFLYLDRPDLPSEDEQYRDAVSVLKAVEGRCVTFRTLDLGADKLPLFLDLPRGHNPALGVRSLRFSLERPLVFRTQLRALYRASTAGPMRIMLPLVTNATELRQAVAICASVRQSLVEEGIAHDAGVPIGIMIETPSAALTVDLLAQHAEFFSLGTNDLIQYACAADRENADVAHLRNPLQPAVLRLLKRTIDAAADARIPLSICGDMAGDPGLTWVLLGLGLRNLSMEAHALPVVKALIRQSSMEESRALAKKVLACPDGDAARDLIRLAMGPSFAADLGGCLSDGAVRSR